MENVWDLKYRKLELVDTLGRVERERQKKKGGGENLEQKTFKFELRKLLNLRVKTWEFTEN